MNTNLGLHTQIGWCYTPRKKKSRCSFLIASSHQETKMGTKIEKEQIWIEFSGSEAHNPNHFCFYLKLTYFIDTRIHSHCLLSYLISNLIIEICYAFWIQRSNVRFHPQLSGISPLWSQWTKPVPDPVSIQKACSMQSGKEPDVYFSHSNYPSLKNFPVDKGTWLSLPFFNTFQYFHLLPIEFQFSCTEL